MDTPITISSTLSSINKPSKKSGNPHSESSITRVPVSWDSPLKPYDRASSCSPSTLQKVNNWINSLNRVKRRNVASSNDCHKGNSNCSEFDNGLDVEEDFRRGMMLSSEFSKSESKEDKMIEDELNQYCNATYSSCEKARQSRTTPRSPGEALYAGGPKKYSHPKEIKRRRSAPTHMEEKEVAKSDDSDSDVPLSPESEKKKELCSYLQLMKPTDKKTVMILQNRRSVRVRNLSLMQEKKELEKKLKEGPLEDTDNSLSILPSLQPFGEAALPEEKEHKWLKYNKAKDQPFLFPQPKDDLKDVVTDFEEVIHEDWFKNWRDHNENRKTSNNDDNKNELENNVGTKPVVGLHAVKGAPNNESNENSGFISKPKLGSKRAGVNSKENNVQEKRAKITKNGDKVSPKNVGDAKNKTENKVRESNPKSPKVLNGVKSKPEKASFKEKSNKDLENKSNPSSNEQERVTVQSPKSHFDSFSMPKLPTVLSAGVHDFADIIQDEHIVEKNSLSISENDKADIETKLPNPIKTNHPSVKNENKSILNMPPGIIINFGNVIQEEKDYLISNESKSLNPVKTKITPLEKKNKIKKRKTPHVARRSSSFKIKLFSKRKGSGSPSKNLVKTVSGLPSSNLKAPPLRSSSKSLDKNVSGLPFNDLKSPLDNSPDQSKTSVKKKVAKLKQKAYLTKKENSKKKDHSPKQSKDAVDSLPKSPLKDTNENPLPCEINEPLVPNVEKKDFTSKSPKIGDLPSSIPEITLVKPSKARKMRVPSNNRIEQEETEQSAIMVIFKYPSNEDPQIEETGTKSKPEFHSEILNVEKSSEENLAEPKIAENSNIEDVQQSLSRLQTNSTPANISKGRLKPVSSRTDLPQVEKISPEHTPFVSFKKDTGVKPLHRCLKSSKKKNTAAVNLEADSSPSNWCSGSPSHRQKKNEHSILISREHGPVLKIFYMEYNLVLCQESLVSFWTQTALGNVLGAQNMWISKGSVQRLSMNNKCVFKESLEMVVSTENNVAYIELWTKEHQSDIREGPVADVFAIVYFWQKGHNGLDKKVLQLENINGFADDVQYSVPRSSSKICVSWHLATNDIGGKNTFIHCYQLAADFQSVCNISEFEAVDHYVSSLHNIEGCDTLIMGCGENKITLWNIEYGHVAATIEMSEIKSPLSTLWVKCDRGFLFTLQQCVDRELRLIAIHGMNHSWKKLASYVPPEDYDRLKGVCVENGIVLACYDQGIICWNAHTADTVLEVSQTEAEYLSGKYIISIVNDQVSVRHGITHLLSAEDT